LRRIVADNTGFLLLYLLAVVGAFFVLGPIQSQQAGPFGDARNIAMNLVLWSMLTLPVMVLYALLNCFVRNSLIVSLLVLQAIYTAATLAAGVLMEPLMVKDLLQQGQAAVQIDALKTQFVYLKTYAFAGLIIVAAFAASAHARFVALGVCLLQVAVVAAAVYLFS